MESPVETPLFSEISAFKSPKHTMERSSRDISGASYPLDIFEDAVDALFGNASEACNFLIPDIVKSMSEHDQNVLQILYNNLMFTFDSLTADVTNELMEAGDVEPNGPIWKHYMSKLDAFKLSYQNLIDSS